MANGARQVRIFVSSPGDARFERSRLERVIERLNGEFQGVARLSAIRWETEFYKAHTTFQAQIPEAAQCDIVVAIFRARLGTSCRPISRAWRTARPIQAAPPMRCCPQSTPRSMAVFQMSTYSAIRSRRACSSTIRVRPKLRRNGRALKNFSRVGFALRQASSRLPSRPLLRPTISRCRRKHCCASLRHFAHDPAGHFRPRSKIAPLRSRCWGRSRQRANARAFDATPTVTRSLNSK